jgi:hypothetical protein
MRALLIAAGAAALILASGAGSANAGVQVGPFRFFAEPHHHWSGADCRELRQACLHKEQLGEEGRGNCRRYRDVCGRY